MEDIKAITCPNCGAAAVNHQNCEYCGSLLIRLLQIGINLETSAYKDNSKVFKGLIQVLKDNLQLQKQNPKITVGTQLVSYEYYEEYAEDEPLCIDNYILSVRDGVELGASNDGKPHLMVEFTFSEDNSSHMLLLNKFRTLDFLDLFTYYIDKGVDESKLYRYFIDFGDDAEGAARLFSKILQVVFEIPSNSLLKFENEEGETKEQHKEWFLKNIVGQQEIQGTDEQEENELASFLDWKSWKFWGVIFLIICAICAIFAD
ncbi:ribosomal protein L32 [Dysgonomonadaceae bacterium PH5-43]|nr:ribosomal protein L32 [Dysgonomonadaceae bacterium PH5-43]